MSGFRQKFFTIKALFHLQLVLQKQKVHKIWTTEILKYYISETQQLFKPKIKIKAIWKDPSCRHTSPFNPNNCQNSLTGVGSIITSWICSSHKWIWKYYGLLFTVWFTKVVEYLNFSAPYKLSLKYSNKAFLRAIKSCITVAVHSSFQVAS